jgi:protein-disulfide isomerase
MLRQRIVVVVALLLVAAFAVGSMLYTTSVREAAQFLASQQAEALIRPHAPVIGPEDAKVTIVEFFDPSCEACRAFYPMVKQIMAFYPRDVRLVLRYAALHEGSDEAVRIIEGARRQDKYLLALEALLAAQPEWAVHGQPDLEKAWQIVGAAGIDLAKARQDGALPEVAEILRLDAADTKALGVQQTPTFFVNGRPLTDFGPQQLFDLVTDEVNKARNGS